MPRSQVRPLAPLGAVWRFIRSSGKRIAVTIVGGVLLLAGVAMLVLPGPGILVIIGGLAVLASEYAWAQRALEATKRRAKGAAGAAKRGFGRLRRKRPSGRSDPNRPSG